MLAYSQCMRAHGITDFPDPDSQGRIALQGGPGSDLDPNNPTFQAAQTACQALQPKPSPGQQRQMQQDALKYSRCMRAHGISDFPDPGGNGTLKISGGPGSDLNPNNPAFQHAQSKCQHLIPGLKAPGKSFSTNGGQQSGSGSVAS